jgi:protein gp37
MAARLKAMALADIAAGKDPGRKRHYIDAIDDKGRWSGKLIPVPEALADPLSWKKPRQVFVNSMSDLFHESVPDHFIDSVFASMALCPQHTFQVLTKRAERMSRYLNADGRSFKIEQQGWGFQIGGHSMKRPVQLEAWPLPNVWLGVSVERQQEANERISWLVETEAAVRFLSCEPLLGPLDLNLPWIHHHDGTVEKTSAIDWVIVGGESGYGARPMHPDWARSLRDQCQAAGVPFFFKQWGGWTPSDAKPVRGTHTGGGIYLLPDGHWGNQGDWWDGNAAAMDRVRKKLAGRALDGREWDEFPTVAMAAQL